MPKWHTIAFTGLELRGLWVRCTGGDTASDPTLDMAAEIALDKIWRTENGMPRRPTPEPVGGKKAGAPLDMTRKHRQYNCACAKCVAKKTAA